MVAGAPVAVLVECEPLVEPVSTWLKHESEVGTHKGLGEWRVVCQSQGGQAAREAALKEAVRWLAEYTPPQQDFQVGNKILRTSLQLYDTSSSAATRGRPTMAL